MAAATPNPVTTLTANTFSAENTTGSCLDDPNFATICSFIQNFGEIIRIGKIPFDELQQMLENTADVPLPLVQLHITLLRRVFKAVTLDKWERSLAKFGHTYCSQDAWEIERFGYKKAKIQTKLRLLKNLLEAQFDYNVKFKAEVNKLQAADLRLTPLGRDTEGQVYWYQVDEDANLRVYREDIDDETWEIVASNKDELEELISQLQRGEVKKPEPEETIIVPEEDSNSKDDIEPKEIILDTGKVEDDGSTAENSGESDEGDDNKLDKRTVEPLIIKHSFNLSKLHSGETENVKNNGDDEKYEISRSSESEPKVPGIKLVFGVKSKSKSDSAEEENLNVANVEQPSKDHSKKSEVVEPSSSTNKFAWSVCASPHPQATVAPTAQPQNQSLENENKVADITADKITTVEIHDKKDKSMPVNLVNTKTTVKTSSTLNIDLPKSELQQEIPVKSEKLDCQTNIEQKEYIDKAKQEEPRKTNEQQTPKTITAAQEVPTKSSDLQVELQAKSELQKRELQNIADQRNPQTSAEKRELQTKARKSLQKSAKVNSIVERLNKNLPDNSIKTVADILPPPVPENVKQDTSQQRQVSKDLVQKPEIQKLTTKFTDAVDSSVSKNDPVSLNVKDKNAKLVVPANVRDESAHTLHVPDTMKQPRDDKQPNFSITVAGTERTDKSTSSIISDLKSPLDSQNIGGDKMVERTDKEHFGLIGAANDLNAGPPKSGCIPKDNVKQVSISDTPVSVPEIKSNVNKSAFPVVEEIVEKTETWTCGKEQASVNEELVIKQNAWVCGDSKNTTSKIYELKSESEVKIPMPSSVNEKSSVKENTRDCDDTENSTTKSHGLKPDSEPKVGPSVKEKLITKENTWVCGDSENAKNQIVSQDFEASKICLPDTISPKTTEKVADLEENAPVDTEQSLTLPIQSAEVPSSLVTLDVKKKERGDTAVENMKSTGQSPNFNEADSSLTEENSKNESLIAPDKHEILSASTIDEVKKIEDAKISGVTLPTAPPSQDFLHTSDVKENDTKTVRFTANNVKDHEGKTLLSPSPLELSLVNNANERDTAAEIPVSLESSSPTIKVKAHDIELVTPTSQPELMSVNIAKDHDDEVGIPTSHPDVTKINAAKDHGAEVVIATSHSGVSTVENDKVHEISDAVGTSACITKNNETMSAENTGKEAATECLENIHTVKVAEVNEKPAETASASVAQLENPEKVSGESLTKMTSEIIPPDTPADIDLAGAPTSTNKTQTPTEQISKTLEINTPSDPEPTVTALDKVSDESSLATSQSLPTVADVEKVEKIVPEMIQTSDKEASNLSISKDNQSEVEHNVSSACKLSDSKEVPIINTKESQKEKFEESTPLTTKVNSSLVSALYSESSESSNEDFPTTTSIETPCKTVTSKDPQLGISAKENETSCAESNKVINLDGKVESTSDSINIGCGDIQNKVLTKEHELPSSDLSTNKSVPVQDREISMQTITSANNEMPEPTIVDDKMCSSEKPMEPNSNTGLLLDTNDSKETDVSSTDPVGSIVTSTGIKRKAEDEMDSLSKIRKVTEEKIEPIQVKGDNTTDAPSNPIVGETIEEEVVTITGEGSGAMNEGRNSPVPFDPICGETIEEEVMNIVGEGFGTLNQGSNENSPVSISVMDMVGSQNESIESDESREALSSSRGRGGRRGRGRRGRPSAGGGRSSQPANSPRNNNRGTRGSREVARLGVSLDSVELNGDNERPVRASRRIAQIRLKEEEERRKLEEERLAQLKAAQMQKKAKQEEKEKKKDNQTPSSKVKKSAGRKSLKDQVQFATEYVPSGSESEDNSDDDDDGSDEFSGKLGKGGKRRRRRKNGKAKKGGNPWATSDEDEEEEQVEEEEEYHEEEEEEELVFKSDHEFSPESDLGEDGDVGPSRHARTAKQDKGDLFEEGNCCKCGKGDHPEWILLCDKCDKGWHASCLRPQLWVVPEGEWFCPPCQHNMLIENLSKNLVEYESLLKKKENEILRKQRLAYVGISLDNVLPDKEPEVREPEPQQDGNIEKDRKRQRRRILSDEELSDDFINDNYSDDDLSRSRSGSGSEDSEDEPVYRLRARRTKKAFNFKEYDDMINSAIRVDDDEEVGELEKIDQDEEGDDDTKLNGEDKADRGGGVGGGKNDAYLKHLERQAQEEDETDEELLDEKERLRRKELKKHGQRKARRRINDLDAYTDEEDSDDDFKASEAEDDDEELAEDGESEWSGDKMEEDSDDSIAKRARRKDRQGRHGRLGRREKYSDKGLVRRSTRKRRSRISYDESDDEDEEEDQNDKWQSDESEEEEDDESESNSESDDATWGKRKKKGFGGAKPKLSNFVLGASSSAKGKGKGGVKRKKRKTDDDDVDRAWNSARSKKEKDEPIERRTRGRKINFKDILDSGESDDDGNVRPKRRPLSDSDDSRSPSSSRRLAEEIRAENARKEKEYEESKAKAEAAAAAAAAAANKVNLESTTTNTKDSNLENASVTTIMPQLLSVGNLTESSMEKASIPAAHKALPLAGAKPVIMHCGSSPTLSSSPNNIATISSPITTTRSPSSVVVPTTATLPIPPNLSPVHLSSPPPSSLPSTIPGTLISAITPDLTSVLPKSPPPPFIPKSGPPALSTGLLASSSSIPPIIQSSSTPRVLSTRPVPPNVSVGSVHPPISTVSVSSNISKHSVASNLPVGQISPNLSIGHGPPNVPLGSPHKSVPPPISVPPPVPVPVLNEKKSLKQSKSSRGSRGSKSDKQLLPPIPSPSDLELALTKPVKTSTLGNTSSKSSSKKKDREREGSVNIPNPSLLMAGGVLPELLGVGLSSSLRPGPSVPSPSGSSSKKGKNSSSSRTTQQTTPPPVSQNLSPSLPIDIDRVPNPALFQGNPGIRPFHPMWAVRNPGPPPQGYSPSGSPVPASIGKPPPLNTSPFTGQQGPSPRPGFSSPPPLRIPNPNTSPLQAFQHFKRDGPLGGPLYRLPAGQPQSGVPLPNILPPGMMSPHTAGAERFFAAPHGYPHPYGLLPPHSQGPPQALFPYDYRAPESPFKDEPTPPRTTASSLPTPVSSASSSPPPTQPASVPLSTKDEGSTARDSEFGGLVSYFSSQRSEEDMDT